MSENTSELLDIFDGDTPTVSAPLKKERKLKSIYADQLLCLLALMGLGIWQSGTRALVIAAISILVCMLSDFIFCRMTKKTYNPKDLSTFAAGLCIALMMPASVSYGIVAGGALIAMGIKHIFGGKDNYIFNPTAAAIAFLIICFPGEMLAYPDRGVQLPIFGSAGTELVSGIESYLIKIGTAPAVSFEDLLIGNYVGPLGTTHFLVLVVCGICLLARRSMSLLVTLSGLGSYFALTALFPVYSSIGSTIMLELIGGYLLFGFVFLASDPQTLPKTVSGKIAYGLVIGITGCLFRHFGKVEGSFLFVLLIANALSLNIDAVCAGANDKIKRALSYLFRNMGRYERLKKTAESGPPAPRLTDTMEIIVPPTNYNMPPIDGKVTKIKHGKGFSPSRIVKICKIQWKKGKNVYRKKREKQLILQRERTRERLEKEKALREQREREKAQKELERAQKELEKEQLRQAQLAEQQAEAAEAEQPDEPIIIEETEVVQPEAPAESENEQAETAETAEQPETPEAEAIETQQRETEQTQQDVRQTKDAPQEGTES